jgi:hypothetical protein
MKLLGRRGDGPMPVHGCQRAQLADRQLPQKPPGHRSALYKKIFGDPKDNKISLIRQIAFLYVGGLPIRIESVPKRMRGDGHG